MRRLRITAALCSAWCASLLFILLQARSFGLVASGWGWQAILGESLLVSGGVIFGLLSIAPFD